MWTHCTLIGRHRVEDMDVQSLVMRQNNAVMNIRGSVQSHVWLAQLKYFEPDGSPSSKAYKEYFVHQERGGEALGFNSVKKAVWPDTLASCGKHCQEFSHCWHVPGNSVEESSFSS